MSTLNERLTRIRESFARSAPAEARAIMHRSTEDLRASGILDGIPAVGDALPAFELADTEGELVRSDDLLHEGPLVVTFYRGVW